MFIDEVLMPRVLIIARQIKQNHQAIRKFQNVCRPNQRSTVIFQTQSSIMNSLLADNTYTKLRT